jgi:hypothetical protein
MTMQPADVRFGRLERQGVLLGLSAAQVALIGAALVAVVAGGMASGPIGILAVGPVWGTALLLALLPAGARPLVEAMPIVVPWALRHVLKRSTVLAPPRQPEVLRIPGVPGSLRVVEDDASGAGLIRPVRRSGQFPFVVVARVRGRGFLLEDAGAQDRQVDGWCRLLGSLSQLPHVSGVQVLHRTTTATTADVAAWWAAQPRTGVAWARRIADDLAADSTGSARLDCLLVFSVRPRRGVAASTILGFVADALGSAGVDLDCWLTVRQINGVIRSSYAGAVDEAGTAGPMGVSEAWSYARSDTAFHATFWVSEWPRSVTHPGFLRSLVLAPGTTRTFSLTAEPLPTGKALREIRRARAEQVVDATTRARIGQVEDEATRAAAAELARREEDLIAGHGDLRFTGLVSVSAATLDELDDACAALESAAGQAGCELRRLVGQQVQAFAAAALPLARVLA